MFQSITLSRVTTCENNMITGGSFASNTLTLNRASGNLRIGGFTSGGAQSVNVSLSGSTLTVNVDGHSDSVNLQSASSLSGSIHLYEEDEAPRIGITVGSQAGSTNYYYSNLNNHDTGSFSKSSVTVYAMKGKTGDIERATNTSRTVSISSLDLIAGFVKDYSLQGSGYVVIEGAIDYWKDYSGSRFSTGNSDDPTITMTLQVTSGNISSASLATCFAEESENVSIQPTFYVNSIRVL